MSDKTTIPSAVRVGQIIRLHEWNDDLRASITHIGEVQKVWQNEDGVYCASLLGPTGDLVAVTLLGARPGLRQLELIREAPPTTNGSIILGYDSRYMRGAYLILVDGRWCFNEHQTEAIDYEATPQHYLSSFRVIHEPPTDDDMAPR